MNPSGRLGFLRAVTFAIAVAAGAASWAAQEASAAAAWSRDANIVPLAVRYRVTVTPSAKGNRNAAPVRRQEWYFYRDARQVALLKGAIDEVWHRDGSGRLSFERVFHDDRRTVEYSAGELASLGIQADWVALASFIDPQILRALRVVASGGAGPRERLRLVGTVTGETLRVDWLPALQVPARIVKVGRDGQSTHIELLQHAAAPAAGWPVPGVRSAEYLRLDAADFGDMQYDRVVRKSEALDVRLGWRSLHPHE